MRKEYAHARSLAIAQAQVLRAHDEIKMATSRLRLRENEDDKSIDALGTEELDIASAENSSEKFLALSSLLRIKGQLRYLKVTKESTIIWLYITSPLLVRTSLSIIFVLHPFVLTMLEILFESHCRGIRIKTHQSLCD